MLNNNKIVKFFYNINSNYEKIFFVKKISI